jgi:hypothetical protein
VQRRDFLSAAGLLAGSAAFPQMMLGQAATTPLVNDPLKPFLLKALPPLDHKGNMDRHPVKN